MELLNKPVVLQFFRASIKYCYKRRHKLDFGVASCLVHHPVCISRLYSTDKKSLYNNLHHPFCVSRLHSTHLCDVYHPVFASRLYSTDKKSLNDDLLKVAKHSWANDDLILNPMSLRKSSSSYRFLKSSKHGKKQKYTIFTKEGKLSPASAIEEQLLKLMQMWEVEDAVELLKESVVNGVEPNKNIILDLLQQLANLGEVNCLLELHEFLLDRGLTTNLRFYHCLRDAYFNSGRIEEGVAMLRIIYHGTRDFEDADMFFTLLATMTITHFEHHVSLLESFVTDLEESDPPVLSARASLWRCCVLAEKFDKADRIVEQHESVKKIIPGQVTKLLHSQLQMDYNKDVVLQWLQQLPYIKAGLKASVFDTLIQYKSQQGEWSQGLDLLSSAMDQTMKVHQHTVQLFLTQFLGQLSKKQIQHLSDWAKNLKEISDGEEN